MKVIREYPTHHYEEEYKQAHTFCPSCGDYPVFMEQGPGDYYLGPIYLCGKCDNAFNLIERSQSKEDLKIISQLKTGVKIIPKTPRGK